MDAHSTASLIKALLPQTNTVINGAKGQRLPPM
jgi:hypothetical protein